MTEDREQASGCPSVVKRARVSRWPAVPMSGALQMIEQLTNEFPAESKVYPVAALRPGRVLAEQIFASEDVPSSRISIKDGYAVVSSDGIGIRQVVGYSTAGSPYMSQLLPGQCCRVSTGAVVPIGADAVIQVEDTELSKAFDDIEIEVNFLKAAHPGQDIRYPGSDMRKGDLLLDIGCELGSAEIGMLNAFGIQHVEIYRKPKVCVISTGNELVESYTTSLKDGQIRDSNRPQLLALFGGLGFKAIDAGIVQDTPEAIEAIIRISLQYASVIVTSGGVSMGEKDHLKMVLHDRLALTIIFGRVWMKPGLPCTVAYGQIDGREVAVFALPGNPASSWVCAHLFVNPFLKGMAGLAKTRATVIKVKANQAIKLGPRPEYCRAFVESFLGMDYPLAMLTGNQISSRQMSLCGAQVLLILPQASEELREVPIGALIDAMVIAGL